MTQKHQIVKSGFWQLMNTGVIVFSQLVYYALMARLISKSDFGIMALLNATLNFGSVVAEAGMGDALLQRKHVEAGHKTAALYYSLATSVLFYIIAFFLAPFIAHFYNEVVLIKGIRILGISFILYALGSPSLNLLQKEFQFKKIFFSDSLSLLASNIFGLVLASMGWGVMSLVYSTLFYNIAKLIMLWIQEPLPIRIKTTWQHWKDLFNYGIMLTLIRIVNYLNSFGINFLIGKLVSISTLGVFERSYRIMNLPGRYLGDIVQKISLPAMVKVSDKKEQLFHLFRRSLSMVLTVLIPFSIFLSVFSKPVVLLLLGTRWTEAVLPLAILFLNLPFRISVRLSDGLMRVSNLLGNNFVRKVISLIFLLILIYVGSFWGLIGIAAGITLATIQNYISMLIVIRKKMFTEHFFSVFFSPFIHGMKLSLFIVLPAYACFYAINVLLKNELYSFIILCIIVSLFLLFVFIKKPNWLGKDLHSFQEVVKEIINKRTKNKKKKVLHTP